MNWKMAAAAFVALPALLAGGVSGTPNAWADTTGNSGGLASGAEILFVMGFGGGLIQPNSTATPPTVVDFTTSRYGYVRNDYMGVVQGYDGSYSVSYSNPSVSLSHQIPGMLSFGNQTGSLTSTSDNLGPLNGFNFSDPSAYFGIGGQTTGYGVWPLAGRWNSTTVTGYNAYGYDYSAYTRAQIDGGTITPTTVNIVGGDAATTIQAPTYINGTLQSQFRLFTGTGNGNGGGTGAGQSGDVTLLQELALYRSTCRIHWRLTNSDSVAHTVTLRFVVNVRGSASQTGSSTQGQIFPNGGFYFQDPNRGVSNLVTVLPQVPDQLNIYGRRFEDDLNSTSPSFAARHTYRGFGATPPTQVYVTNPFELRPDLGGFLPGSLTQGFLPILDNGIATASYFGPYTLAPGQTQDIITFYGNGTPTELLNDDFVTATETRESLAFDSAAALRVGVIGNRNATNTTVGTQFLSPNPLTVYGGIYNRIPSTPLNNVNLTNVSAALVLPQGLILATNALTGVQDTAQKTLGTGGTVLGDKDATTSWQVQPTAEAYGALPYQMTVSTSEFGSRTATRVINIPATPLHAVTASSFQMLGFPFQFDPVQSNNGDPSTIVNSLTSPTDEPVAFYRWVPDTTSVSGVEGRYQLANRLDTGVAYFYRPNLNRTIFAKGVQPVAGQATNGADTIAGFAGPTTSAGINQVQINLERGWNMISNPYLYDIPLNYLRFSLSDGSNTSGASQTFAESVNNGLVRGGVFFYNTTTKSYDFFDQIDSPLRPWQGYWLFNSSRVTLIYTLPTQRNSVVLPTPGTPPIEPPTRDYTKNQKIVARVPLAKKVDGALESGRALGKQQPVMDNWKLQLIASKPSGSSDKATIIGVSPTGRDTNNAIQNLPKPPPPVSDYVYVGIVREGARTRYAQDIKGPSGTKTWVVEVQSDTDGRVTLQWPTASRLPRNLSLTVKNEATGRVSNLHSLSSLGLDMKQGQPTRLVFTASKLNSQPLTISNLYATSGGRAVGGVSIGFDLSQEAQVNGVITTLSGRVVAIMGGSGKAFSVGQGRLSWTGRATNGSALPAGVYQAIVTAKDDTTTVTKIVPIQSLR